MSGGSFSHSTLRCLPKRSAEFVSDAKADKIRSRLVGISGPNHIVGKLFEC